ncbi:hypothetical protein PCANC_14033 [Puccinia coronata f. sp. avenae]|uniref:Uncharacterized protein n=1 Tax=Puccinia coronata f. sp. avenae TaxID=200324 RepID=A0A2N5VRK5_9BASI|nr:hypothetical protein PCANC_14033 [Puccinia coronata f. sp. avenae]
MPLPLPLLGQSRGKARFCDKSGKSATTCSAEKRAFATKAVKAPPPYLRVLVPLIRVLIILIRVLVTLIRDRSAQVGTLLRVPVAGTLIRVPLTGNLIRVPIPGTLIRVPVARTLMRVPAGPAANQKKNAEHLSGERGAAPRGTEFARQALCQLGVAQCLGGLRSPSERCAASSSAAMKLQSSWARRSPWGD